MNSLKLLPLLAISVTLAACHNSDSKTETRSVVIKSDDKTVSGISIDSDKFKASIEIPGVELNGAKMDIDGMKLPAGSRVKAMRVRATDHNGEKKGAVSFDFTVPMAPEAVATHLTEQAKSSKWTALTRSIAADGAIVLHATKSEDGQDTLEYRLLADGSGTRGTAQIIGAHDSDKSGW